MAIRFDSAFYGIRQEGLSAETKALITESGAYKTFSLWGWLRPQSQPAAGFQNIAMFTRASDDSRMLTVRYYPAATRYRASIRNAADSETGHCDILSVPAPKMGENILWCLSCTPTAMRLFMRREAGSGVETSAGINPSAYGTQPDVDAFELGKDTLGTHNALPGSYYGVYLRNHEATANDVAAVWAANNPAAIMFLSGGDNLDGLDGLQWAFGLGSVHSQQWLDNTFTSSGSTRHLPGDPITDRLKIFDVNGPNGAGTDPRWYTFRPVSVLRGTTFPQAPYITTWNQPGDEAGFTPLATSGSVEADVPVDSNKIARLAYNRPSGIMRVAGFSNSRCATQGDDETRLAPNFMSGPQYLRPETCAGVDVVPISASVLNYQRGYSRFGFDNTDQLPKASTSPLQSMSAATHKTICAYGLSQTSDSSEGPGEFVELKAGKTFRWLFKPGGAATADRRLRISLRYFLWPKSGLFRYRTARDRQQNETADAVYGDWSDWIDPSTAVVYEHAITAGEAASYGSSAITLTGTGLGIAAGQICVRDDTYDVANVASVVEVGGNTVVTFDHAFSSAPLEDEMLRFGAWDYGTLTEDFDAVTDNATWRGIEIEADDATSYGLMTAGMGGWALDVDGFVYIAAGVGGTTFPQIMDRINTTGPDGAATGPEARWLAEVINADIGIVLTNFTSGGYSAFIPKVLGSGADVLAWGEADWGFPYGSTDYADECNTLRAAAIDNNCGYISTYNEVGSPADRILLGENYDVPAHMTVKGYSRIWKAGIPKMQAATRSSAPLNMSLTLARLEDFLADHGLIAAYEQEVKRDH